MKIHGIMSVICHIYRWIYQQTNKNTDGITYSFPIGDMLNLLMEISTE